MNKDYIKTDEKNHVEEPFLLQLQAMENFTEDALYWDVMRLDKAQQPADTGRESFEEVVFFTECLTDQGIGTCTSVTAL